MKRTVKELPARELPTVKKMRAALEDLGDCWMYTAEFCEDYGMCSKTVHGNKRFFDGHWMDTTSGRIWSGSKKTIETIKEKLNG